MILCFTLQSNKMKKIITLFKEVSILKFILGSFVILIIVCLIIFGPLMFKNYTNHREKEILEKKQAIDSAQKKEIENRAGVIKDWHSEQLNSIGAKEIRLTTKWANGSLMYKFEIDFEKGNNIIIKNRNSYRAFTIYFMDSDGFKLSSFRVPLNDMLTTINNDGTATGMSMNSKFEMDVSHYQKFSDWSIEWNF